MTRLILLVTLAIASLVSLHAQDRPPFQDDFPAEEFVQRRVRVMDAIGTEATVASPTSALKSWRPGRISPTRV